MTTELARDKMVLRKTPELSNDFLDKARRGDEKAFAKIVRHYEDMVYGFSFKVCRDKQYAEETLQDTFVNVYRKLNQFDGKSKFSTWLYSIVTNNCLMKRRRRKLEKDSVSIDEVTDPRRQNDPWSDHEDRQLAIQSWRNSPLEEAMSRELRERLDDAIRKLPVDYRLVFILRDIEDKIGRRNGNDHEINRPGGEVTSSPGTRISAGTIE